MTDLYLYDDATARRMEPFALTRPTSELRAGAALLRERWERAFGMKAAGVVCAEHLADFEEPWSTRAARGTLKAGSIVANSRAAVALQPAAPGAAGWRILDDKRLAAVVLSRDVRVDEFADGTVALESFLAPGGRVFDVGGWWLERIWDFVARLSPMLVADLSLMTERMKPVKVDGIGKGLPVFAEEGATIEPHTFFDTSAGPVYVSRGAVVQAFTRIVGPCFIGADSLVGGDKISGSSIGEVCRVHGELSATVFVGHANKSHDGFVGHSYLGRWVNLGAGTITSNLKNTYGSVQLWTPTGLEDTGLQFLGTLFGDHVKTGIGTSMNTGTVLGAGANVYGSRMPPKVVAPFAWGERPPYSTYRFDKFIEVVRKVMTRRHVELSEEQERQLSVAYERRWSAGAEAKA